MIVDSTMMSRWSVNLAIAAQAIENAREAWSMGAHEACATQLVSAAMILGCEIDARRIGRHSDAGNPRPVQLLLRKCWLKIAGVAVYRTDCICLGGNELMLDQIAQLGDGIWQAGFLLQQAVRAAGGR